MGLVWLMHANLVHARSVTAVLHPLCSVRPDAVDMHGGLRAAGGVSANIFYHRFVKYSSNGQPACL